ncbi:MAG: hypothetical protein OXH60_03040 [Rhodospirillales bacterium]|nr:hypothetical protein [Rhodospirillales bacterium]
MRFRTSFTVIRHSANRSDIQAPTGFPAIVDPDNLHTLGLLM